MAKGKIKEKHITVTEETHAKLMALSKVQRRTMRVIVTQWIDEQYETLNKRK